MHTVPYTEYTQYVAIDCICKYPYFTASSGQDTDCLQPAADIILQDKNSIEKSLLKCEEQFQKQVYFFFFMWDSEIRRR